MKEIKFIAAPFHLGGSSEGIEGGYEKYKNGFPFEYILDVYKFKEDFSNPNLKNLDAVIKMTKELSNQISKIVKNNNVPLVIGGDHSIALGTISGTSEQIDNLGVVWIDAHGDMNTDETTPSGNIHGMVLAALQGIGNEKLTGLVSNRIPTKNVTIFGTRDLDKGEKELMDSVGIAYFPYNIIESDGLMKTLMELKRRMENIKQLHLSIDLDSINPILAPGVSTPVKNGFSLENIHSIIDFLFECFEIVAIDIVEYNSAEDIDDKTLNIMKEIIELIVGKY